LESDSIFNFPHDIVNEDKSMFGYKWEFFCDKVGENVSILRWEWGRISDPYSRVEKPCYTILKLPVKDRNQPQKVIIF
jgi:hypothetical protein